jgi:hypothetical protein
MVVFVQHTFVSKYQNQLMLKIGTLVLANKRKQQIFLNLMKNQEVSLK